MTEYASYESLVARWGFEVVDMTIFGSYQGDYAVLLRDGDRWGWTVFGYGSCSGCDALEAAVGYSDDDPWNSDVQELSDGLLSGVKWGTSAELVTHLSDEYVQKGKWSWYEDGFQGHVHATIEKLTTT